MYIGIRDARRRLRTTRAADLAVALVCTHQPSHLTLGAGCGDMYLGIISANASFAGRTTTSFARAMIRPFRASASCVVSLDTWDGPRWERNVGVRSTSGMECLNTAKISSMDSMREGAVERRCGFRATVLVPLVCGSTGDPKAIVNQSISGFNDNHSLAVLRSGDKQYELVKPCNTDGKKPYRLPVYAIHPLGARGTLWACRAYCTYSGPSLSVESR